MHQKRSVKLLPRNCLFAIMILTSTVIGQTACSDSNSNNYNSEPYASNQRKMPSSGSGSGETKFEKRSSFAVISQAMSETINSEFGSEYRSCLLPHPGWSPLSWKKTGRNRWRSRSSHKLIFIVAIACGQPQDIKVTALDACVFNYILTLPTNNISSSFRVTPRKKKTNRHKNHSQVPHNRRISARRSEEIKMLRIVSLNYF